MTTTIIIVIIIMVVAQGCQEITIRFTTMGENIRRRRRQWVEQWDNSFMIGTITWLTACVCEIGLILGILNYFIARRQTIAFGKKICFQRTAKNATWREAPKMFFFINYQTEWQVVTLVLINRKMQILIAEKLRKNNSKICC